MPASAVSRPPPFSLTSLNQYHLFQEENNTLEVAGSGFDAGVSFTVKFSQAGVEKKSISITPTDSAKLSAVISSALLTDLSPGLYDMAVTRSTDSETKTYLTKIAITRRGDLWSSDAAETSLRKRDGKIDIYDVSRMLSKWGSALSADLAEADINSGPGNISQGKIDLYDANMMMKNWTP